MTKDEMKKYLAFWNEELNTSYLYKQIARNIWRIHRCICL